MDSKAKCPYHQDAAIWTVPYPLISQVFSQCRCINFRILGMSLVEIL